MVDNISEKEKKLKSYLLAGLFPTFWTLIKITGKRQNEHFLEKSCYGVEETIVMG